MTKYLLLACGVLTLLLGGAGWLLKQSWASNARLEGVVADRDAVIRQKNEDADLSAHIIGQQQIALSALDEKTNAALAQVYREPTSTTCAQSPAMRAATRSLRQLFDDDRQPPAGRQPAAAVH
ncbi:MAG: hypothetical protein JSR24_08305 [Proteobacteria bacterium]|nr:hypothetical protein [Pseudomonadota bacterium]